jgi:hypothetical protein
MAGKLRDMKIEPKQRLQTTLRSKARELVKLVLEISK